MYVWSTDIKKAISGGKEKIAFFEDSISGSARKCDVTGKESNSQNYSSTKWN